MGIVDMEQDAARAELVAAVAKTREGTHETRAAIERCREAQLTVTEIAEIVGVGRETIYRWIKEDAE